jgi:lipid II:glycine glycyltransferase (peptidoglycan interpeptide bridge formation enzyme)
VSEVRITTTVDKEAWNGHLSRSGSGHFYQTWQWAELCRHYQGSESRFIVLSKDGEGVAGALALQREFLGGVSRPGLAKALRWVPLASSPLKVYRWRYGPALIAIGDEPHRLGVILDAVEEWGRREGVLAIEGINLAGYADAFDPTLAALMRERGYEGTLSATFLVDLSVPEEKLLEACDRSVRKNIRRCAEEGVKVERIATSEGWREFAQMFVASRQRQGLLAPPPRHILLHDEFLNQGEERLMELFVARHNARPIAAFAALAFNGWMTEAMIAYSPYALDSRLPAHDLLKWEAMLWGKANGLHTFDLAGVAPEPQSSKEEGIRRFKAKFGGRYVEYETFRKVLRPDVYKFLTKLRSLRGRGR